MSDRRPANGQPLMRTAITAWWQYGTRRHWRTRDYLRHFSYAAALSFVGLCVLIVALNPVPAAQ